MRARYYNPNLGRFITEDPAKDGLNWYSYCGGNPVGFVDPSGKTMEGDEKLSDSDYKKIKEITEKWKSAETDEEKEKLHQEANKIRAKYIITVLLINAENSVPVTDFYNAGHNAIMFVNSVGQGFYFSVGPSDLSNKSSMGKMILDTGEIRTKILTPSELEKFLKDGKLKNLNYKRSDNTKGFLEKEDSIYTGYINIYTPYVNIDYKNMYNYAEKLYNSVNEYSGLNNNCTTVAGNIISQGNVYLKNLNFSYNKMIPNIYYNSMKKYLEKLKLIKLL